MPKTLPRTCYLLFPVILAVLVFFVGLSNPQEIKAERVGGGTSWGSSDSFSCPPGGVMLPGFSEPIPCDEEEGLAGWFYKLAVWIAVSLAVFLVMVGGYFILTSSGDPGRINRGKEIITNALIGLVFISLSGVILRFIGNVLIGLR